MASIQTAYEWGIEKCNAPNIGYSQANRMEKTVNGITYYDCSSFIWFALKAGGFDVVKANGGSTWAFTTGTMANALRLLGFTKMGTAQPWKPGDILIRTGHTEMAFDSNHTMGAHSAKVPLEQQVSINSNPSNASSWLELWRYEGGAKTNWIKGNRYLSTGEMQNNAQIIFNTLLLKGWTKNAIAGMLGNMQKESTINPGIWQNLNPNPLLGWGLVQWTPSTNFTDWAAANGYANDDGDAQLIWIDTVTASVGQWIPTTQYPETFGEFKVSTQTPEYLADCFLKNFERPGEIDQPDRQRYARYWFNWWEGSPVPPPNPNPEPDWKRSMPIWFALKKY